MDEVVYYALLVAGFGVMWWQHARRVRRMPRLGTRFDEDADIALHVARHEASTRDQPMSPSCILYGLLQNDEITAAIRESGGDPDLIEDRVLAALDAGAEGGDIDVVPIIAWLLEVASARERQVTCIDLWAGLSQHAPTSALLVNAGGVSAAEVLFTLVHGLAEKSVPWPRSEPVSVVLINDDISTQELVVDVLRDVFEKDEGTATELMWQVHREGRGVVGEYDALEARIKIDATRRRARGGGFPLWVKAESLRTR